MCAHQISLRSCKHDTTTHKQLCSLPSPGLRKSRRPNPGAFSFVHSGLGPESKNVRSSSSLLEQNTADSVLIMHIQVPAACRQAQAQPEARSRYAVWGVCCCSQTSNTVSRLPGCARAAPAKMSWIRHAWFTNTPDDRHVDALREHREPRPTTDLEQFVPVCVGSTARREPQIAMQSRATRNASHTRNAAQPGMACRGLHPATTTCGSCCRPLAPGVLDSAIVVC